MMLAALPVGALVGLSVGGLGGGGSVLAVPLLVYLLGQDAPTATTTSLVIVSAAALAGGLRHARSGCVCWRHAALLVGAALPGIAAGTVAGNALGARALLGAFAAVMMVPAVLMWRQRRAAPATGTATGTGTGACPPVRLRCDVGAGFVVGFLTGMFGVGGGFLVVPALALCLAFTMRAAVGTSLAIVASTSLLGLVAHLVAGRTLQPGPTVVLLIGAVAGAVAGARLTSRLPQRAVAGAFTGLVAIVASLLVVSTATS